MRKIVLLIAVILVSLAAAHAYLPVEKAYLFRYSFTVNEIPRGAREIKIWVPLPAENLHQEVTDISSQKLYSITFDKNYRNRIAYYIIKQPDAARFTIEHLYRIRRKEFVNWPQSKTQKHLQQAKEFVPEKYISFDGFVLITQEIVRLARQLTEGKKVDIEKARAIYDYLFANMTYDKAEPGWGRGDIARVCRLKKGNCTDFHSFFIALCRASGIPAKFVIGVPIAEKDGGKPSGYHCWAEFYDKKNGWIPVDISEAWKNKSKYEYYFGAVDAGRIEFSHGRGIKLNPQQKGGPLNYFVYPYVEIDGKQFDNVQTSFYYENIS